MVNGDRQMTPYKICLRHINNCQSNQHMERIIRSIDTMYDNGAITEYEFISLGKKSADKSISMSNN